MATSVIRGGTVVDGTGAPGYRADVVVDGDRIVEIVSPNSRTAADTTIDATDCIVAPGFIDIHTHYDAQVFWDPAMTPSCFHGVTSVVAGNCGFSIAPVRATDRELMAATMEKVEDMDPASLLAGVPWDFETFPDYLSSVARHGVVLNFSAYIGHTAVRLFAMGADAVGRPATEDETRRMAAVVSEAMDAGAAGFATSFAVTHRGADGNPIPSRYADRDEIIALCKAVGDSGRGVIGVNGGTDGQGLRLPDCYDVQQFVGAPITFTAVLTAPNGAHVKAMDIHRAGLARGASVWPQVSCRPLSFSMTMQEPFTLNTSGIFAELMPLDVGGRMRAYADPVWRQRVRDGWAQGQGLVPRWDSYLIMESVANAGLVGRRIAQMAAEQGADPLDVLLDLTLAEAAPKDIRVKALLANDDADGVTMLLNEPGTTLGLSDAGAHVGQLCDAPLPTDLLGNWVRDRGTLPLEKAVRMLSGLQADLFGFADRGYLRTGAFADIAVFDPATVGPGGIRRVRDFPADAERLTADAPTGMRHVFVNGTAIRLNETMIDAALAAKPGAMIRPAARGNRPTS